MLSLQTLGRLAALTVLFSTLSAAAFAQGAAYKVTVDTSPINTTSGFIDLQYNAGGADALASSAQITHFTTNGSLAGTSSNAGDVSGILPGTVTINNGVVANTAVNELFQGTTYGTQLVFDVLFYGPALNPGSPPSSGSRFALALYGSDGVTPQMTTNPNGDAILYIDINPDGTTTPTVFPDGGGGFRATVTVLPEPGVLTLAVGLTLAGATVLRRKRRDA